MKEMLKGVFLVLGLLLLPNIGHAEVLSPTMDGSILDGYVYNVGFVNKDGFPDQLDDVQSVEVFNRFLVEKRGIMEFSIAGLLDPVNQAFLKIHKIDALLTANLNMEIYGYSGNGILDDSDYTNGSMIHSFIYKGEPEPIFNVTPFLQEMQLNHFDYVGFNLRLLDLAPMQPGTSYVAFGSLEDLPSAQLFINQNPPVVPEPATGILFLTGLAGLYFKRKSA